MITKIDLMDDTCAWCRHPLKVATRSWESVNSTHAFPICANYCDNKTCKVDGCNQVCGSIALSTPENEEKMLHEVVRRRRKIERLTAEAESEIEVTPTKD
jgi:hypothetical protein